MKANERYLKGSFKIDRTDLKMYDVKDEPFVIYGLYDVKNQEGFRRMDEDVARRVSDGVYNLHANTSGGRIKFTTDSPFMALSAAVPRVTYRSIMTNLASAGFDVYVTENGAERYLLSIYPPLDLEDSYEGVYNLKDDGKVHEYTVYMPLYNDLSSLHLGFSETAYLGGPLNEYRYKTPVLYYGSSITQGASASRPGMSYEAQISRELSCDFINLGFAGNAKGEDAMIEYLAGIECSVFVCDYDYNAPDVEHLENTHEKLFKEFRKTHKDTPVIFITRPFNGFERHDLALRRDVIYRTYINALKSGDSNVYFVDGFSILGDRGASDCFVDGTHPNDLGFYRMACKIGSAVRCALDSLVAKTEGC